MAAKGKAKSVFFCVLDIIAVFWTNLTCSNWEKKRLCDTNVLSRFRPERFFMILDYPFCTFPLWAQGFMGRQDFTFQVAVLRIPSLLFLFRHLTLLHVTDLCLENLVTLRWTWNIFPKSDFLSLWIIDKYNPPSNEYECCKAQHPRPILI